MVCLFMTPLDVVKIRLQAQSMVFGKKCFLYSNGIMDHLCPRVNGDPPPLALHTAEEICNCRWYNRPKYFSGTFDAFVKIARTEGVSSLWSGLSPTLVVAVPTVMIYFTTYEQLRDLLHCSYLSFTTATTTTMMPAGGATPSWVSLSAGALSRIWAVTLVSPLELVRTKMQSQKMAFYQVRSCLVDLVRSRGIRGLWSGYTATLLRDVPFSALYWPLFEGLRRGLGSDNSFGANFVSGAVAGSIASAATLPFDVIKTHKQIEIGDVDIMQVKKGVAKSNTQIARDIMQEHGVRGFFAGLVPRILKVAPACAIMISSYEFCKAFFRSRNGNNRVPATSLE